MSQALRVLCVVVATAASAGAQPRFASHPPMRPLPVPSTRPAAAGAARFVDATRGNDAADGSKATPWRSLGFAFKQLKPGDTLYLRGTFYEEARLAVRGTPAAPITIRSVPGELAIVDGGFREFAESPQTAWEPVPGGAADEYRSRASYPLGGLDEQGRGVFVTGNFADSMVPLHGYKWSADLRTTNEYWNIKKTEAGTGVNVGPGVWFDPSTKRIHVRLAHGTLHSQPDYKGETDPRKLALVVGGARSALRIEGAKHVRVQDLVLRGSATHTVHVENGDHVTLDGLTIYGGNPALYVRSTGYLELVRSSLRGTAAPWSSRVGMKNRGNSPYLLIADGAAPQNHHWELAYNELVDGHDGAILDGIKSLRFHHNVVDNFNDDALYLTFTPRTTLPDDLQLYENLVTRSYTVLAFAGEKGSKNAIGTGAYVFRNVFDLRDPPYVWLAKDAAADRSPLPSPGRMCGDHGGPIWDPVFFYHNTVITDGRAWRDYYGAQLIIGMRGTTRRLFDNIFVRVDGDPGLYFKGMTDGDLQVDGNLLWGHATGPHFQGDFFAAFRQSSIFEDSKRSYAPGWGAHDLYADPRFARWADRGKGPLDVALQPKSPAIDAGVAIPAAWPDTLRAKDRGRPDIGALPAGVPMFRVGPSAAPSY